MTRQSGTGRSKLFNRKAIENWLVNMFLFSNLTFIQLTSEKKLPNKPEN